MNLNLTEIGALLVALVTTTFSVIQWAVDRHDKRFGISREEFQALRTAVTELAYMRLAERHHRYVTRGWAHHNEKRVCERLYEAYHRIGGNGYGSQMITDIRNLPAYDPNNKPIDDDSTVTD